MISVYAIFQPRVLRRIIKEYDGDNSDAFKRSIPNYYTQLEDSQSTLRHIDHNGEVQLATLHSILGGLGMIVDIDTIRLTFIITIIP